MDERHTPLDPDEAERRFAAMLDEAGLPRFASTFHDAAAHELQCVWDHGLIIDLDLTRDDWDEIDDFERAAILGVPHECDDHEPIHVVVPGSADDPRIDVSIP